MYEKGVGMGEPSRSPAGGSPRSRELSQLLDWFQSDPGSVVLLRGRRGVGKSRLVEELLRETSNRQAAVFDARVPDAGGRSFHPFAEIAHQALMWAEQTGLTEDAVDPVYADIAPVLDHAAAEEEEAADGPSLDQKLRFFEGFRRLLAAIGSRSRVLVVVRDLERADPDTLELAGYLADELFGDPTLDPDKAQLGLLVLTCRDDDLGSRRVREFVEEMGSRPSVRDLRLEGLDLEGLRQYVQSRHVLEKLLAASEGLPQELDALIDALPSNVEELFERKVADMEPLRREVLSALAVSGRPASARLLAEVVQHPVRTVAKALNALRTDKVLDRRIYNGEFHFGFSRQRDLEVAERFLSQAERHHYHHGWARALQKEGDAGGGPALLAYHQLRSDEPHRGVPLAIQAAETYAVGGALHAAIDMLESALPHAAGELKLSILSRLGELAPLTGNPRRALGYVEEWKAALPKEQQGRALQREAELLNAAGDHAKALETLDRARQHTEDDAWMDRAKIEATAAEAHYHLGRLDEANGAGQESLELLSVVEGNTPSRLRLGLLNLLGRVALAGGDRERAAHFFKETLRGAEKSGLASEQARAQINLGLVAMREGDLESAESHLLDGIAHAREAGDLVRLAGGRLNLGTLHHQRGDLGPAFECYRECRSLFRRLGNRTQLARTLSNLGNVLCLVGDTERAMAHVREAIRLAEQGGQEKLAALSTLVEGVILMEKGRRAEAEARLREGLNARPQEALLELAECAVRFDDPTQARSVLGELSRHAGDGATPNVKGRVELTWGAVHLAEGSPEAAKAHFDAARTTFDGMGRALFVHEAEVGLARAALGSGEREQARHHLAAAEKVSDGIARELPPDARRCFDQSSLRRREQDVLAALEGRANFEPPAEEEAPAETAAAPNGAASEAEPVAPRPQRKAEWKRRYGAIVGSSAKLLKVFHILDRVAESEGTVLLYGESGTGKELVAEAIHRNSPRAKGPFIKLNCAALVETLLLSELFGHERGSFTGAHQRKIGRFEMAAGGTLFLDEIGDISPKTQVALLRVLQEREFERVGGGKPIAVDARIVFATNRNLAQMVKDGTFREDLFYRIKGIQIDLPPLRERPSDIVPLAQHFLAQYAAESATVQKRLSAGAAELLSRYPWPGNIRELENIIRSVALFAEGNVITERDFDEYRELFQDGLTLPAALRYAAAAGAAEVGPGGAEAGSWTGEASAGAGAGRPAFSSESTTGVEPENGPHGVPPPEPNGVPSEAATAAGGPQAVEQELIDQIFRKGVPLPDLKKMIQLQAITRALRMSEGNITKAAEMLGMRRPRLSQIINADDDLKALCQGANK